VDTRKVALQIRIVRITYRVEAARSPAERLESLRARSLAILDNLDQPLLPADLREELALARRELTEPA
jgi:hypothetical protein